MSKIKQMQLEIAHLIENTADQEEIVKMFLEVRGTQSSALRKEIVRKIIDWKTIYGKNLDEAITILINPTIQEKEQA